MNVPQHIFVDGKFIPNVDKVQVPVFKKTGTSTPSWTGVTSCGKTPEEMYKYLFPYG